jgi:hypothetical protein
MSTILMFAFALIAVLAIARSTNLRSQLANERQTSKDYKRAYRRTLRSLNDHKSALQAWIDYASNLQDRLHGIDSFAQTIPQYDALQEPLFQIAESGKIEDMPLMSYSGFSMPEIETLYTPKTGNGNGHKESTQTGTDDPLVDSVLADFAKTRNGNGFDSDKAKALIAKWVAKDADNAESMVAEYQKRLGGIFKDGKSKK